MKMRNKGKIHPLISSSSHHPTQNNDAIFPVLNLLPAAIFTLISLLSIEEREVLAYMVSRSLKSANPPNDYKKKKQPKDCHKSPALFECECFHCYTSFWFRWDSSPNRELIHQAIEAFEEHLNSGEQSRKSGNSRSKKREKMGRLRSDNGGGGDGGAGDVILFPPVESPEKNECHVTVTAPGGEADEDGCGGEAEKVVDVSTEAEEELVVEDGLVAPVAVEGHRGLARKVLPDVMGIFNSRLWRLWSPNA